MPSETTYEFAQVITGLIFTEGDAVTFLQVRTLTGDETTRGFEGGPLGALNLMGAQGWRYLSERPAEKGRVMWISGALSAPGTRLEVKGFEAVEYLMTREVRE